VEIIPTKVKVLSLRCARGAVSSFGLITLDERSSLDELFLLLIKVIEESRLADFVDQAEVPMILLA
jgi:hypothetical protein